MVEIIKFGENIIIVRKKFHNSFYFNIIILKVFQNNDIIFFSKKLRSFIYIKDLILNKYQNI